MLMCTHARTYVCSDEFRFVSLEILKTLASTNYPVVAQVNGFKVLGILLLSYPILSILYVNKFVCYSVLIVFCLFFVSLL